MKHVVIVHGFLMKSPVMSFVAGHLAFRGYRPIFFNYRTLHFNKEKTLSRLEELCKNLDEVYFVGHSMGGLIIRQFLQDKKDDKYKGIVTLGTPHQSSRFAQIVSDSELNNLLGINEHSGLISTLHEWDNDTIPFGSIAGNKPKGLFAVYQKLKEDVKEPHDGTILVEETKGNFNDHVVLPISHTGLVYSKAVVDQIEYFFEHNKFFKS